MSKNKWSDKHMDVLNNIPHCREEAIKQRDLCKRTGLKPRSLKEYITDLRSEYAIVSKQTNGGGYWIAESLDEIQEFVDMISSRRRGYQDTEETMKKFIYSQERMQ